MTFFAVTLIISFSIAQPPSCHTASSRIERVVASTVRELKGKEYCQFRLYDQFNDIDSDGNNDFLMVFSVEAINGSANATRQFLAVFPSGSRWQPSVLEVGQRGVREVLKLEVESQTIVLTTAERKEGDAMCCPSGSGRLLLRLERGTLVASDTRTK